MSLEQEIHKELVDLAARVRDKARELSKRGLEKEAKRATALAKMASLWAEEWK